MNILKEAGTAGRVLTGEAELEAIDENKAIYEEAASKYNFPWQVLAVFLAFVTTK